jgi:hypothetical protein
VRSEALTDRSFVFPSIYTCRLTQRPYSLERFAQLYDMALSFKEQGFPQSQLQNLYDSLFTSFNTASFSTITALARLRKGHRQVLNRFIEQFALMDPPPWARVETNAVDTNADDKIYSSPLGDLIEMYRFISRPRS